MDEDPQEPQKSCDRYTIESLRLNLAEAAAGRTWLLLPEGFRDADAGSTYPLPSRRAELEKLAVIFVPKRKKDSGCAYLRRAHAVWAKRQEKAVSAVLDAGRREQQVKAQQYKYHELIKDLKAQARDAVESVRREAMQAIASLNDLFDLGRQGIDAQMKAHLEGAKWQGETIDAAAFRQCFRMVTQAVKGLGLPTEQRESAKETILEQYAASLEATQDAVALAPGGDGTEH